MTTYNSYKDSRGTPLETFTKSTPPGWDPGQSDTYPLRAYVERLRLFTRMTDLRADQLGPAARAPACCMSGFGLDRSQLLLLSLTETRCTSTLACQPLAGRAARPQARRPAARPGLGRDRLQFLDILGMKKV